MVIGEPGVGKSTMIQQMIKQVGKRIVISSTKNTRYYEAAEKDAY
jgi:GTPase Era involved in 16S rRNA processing